MPIRVIGVAFGYGLLAACSLYFVGSSGRVATMWPCNALLLALLLRNGPPRWIEVLTGGMIGCMTASMIMRGFSPIGVLFGMANLLEVTIAAIPLRRTLASGGLLGAQKTVGHFIFWAGLVAPAASTVIGGYTAYSVLHLAPIAAVTGWYLSDALGLLIFTPFFLSVIDGEYGAALRSTPRPQALRTIAVMLLFGGTTAVVMARTNVPPFCLFPPMMWITFKVGRLGAQVGVMMLAIIGMATMDYGFFALMPGDETLHAHVFQLYLAILLLTCLPVSAELAARASVTRQLIANEDMLRRREGDLIRLASTDSLTGLLNRAAFRAQVEIALTKGKSPILMAAIDLDHFKQINDHHGHQAGDQALCWLARLLRSSLRGDDVIARIGGDEFMVMFTGSPLATVEAICERLTRAVARAPLVLPGGQSLSLSLSCGVADARDGRRYDQLVRHADAALYTAKGQGRNQVVVFSNAA